MGTQSHRVGVLLLVLLLLGAFPLMTWAQARTELTNHVSRQIEGASDLGPTNSAKSLTLTLHLKAQDAAAFEQRLQALYDSSSPYYHSWLGDDALAATLDPSASDLAAVRQFLSANGLKELSAHAGQMRVQGSVANVQKAFDVSIHNFRKNGRVQYANLNNPTLSGRAATVIDAVDGLSEHKMSPHLVRAKQFDGSALAPTPLAAVPQGAIFSAQCIRSPQKETFTSTGTTAVYYGNRYGQDITNDTAGDIAPCGYQPSEIGTAYHLSSLYSNGLDGTGQVIAIVDAYGSTTVQQDLAVFSDFYGLPSADLTVVGTPTASPFSSDADLAGWALETTLDVEWAHAIAPGAKIVLFVSADNADPNLAAAVAQAVQYPGVSVVSNSYGGPESTEDAPGFAAFEAVNKLGAARGISINYSSGDDGDYAIDLNYKDVSYPASSPWATGIGGVSLALKDDHSIAFQTGWGTNITELADTAALGTLPLVPPVNLGFQFGAGGGTSAVFKKPPYQYSLRGGKRMEPDISWLADPYTGVEIIYSVDDTGENFGVDVIGGTSLSCPMFSGLWAIANQRANRKLGLAAYRVYGLHGNAITDVTPVSSLTNVFGVIQSGKKTLFESPSDLAAPLDGNRLFYSALYNSPYSTRWFALTFGTDSSLVVTPGWDDVTGVGTPNGAAFVNAVSSY